MNQSHNQKKIWLIEFIYDRKNALLMDLIFHDYFESKRNLNVSQLKTKIFYFWPYIMLP